MDRQESTETRRTGATAMAILVEIDEDLYDWALRYNTSENDTFSDLLRRLISHEDRDLMKPPPRPEKPKPAVDKTDLLAGDAVALRAKTNHGRLAAGRALKPRRGIT